MSEQEQQLKRIVDLLDFHLGDSDNYLPAEPMTPSEFEGEYPVVAAMQIAVKLMLDARAARTQGAENARPVATLWPVPLEMNQGHVLEHAVELRFESEEDSAKFVRLYGEQTGERVATRDTATRAQAPDSAA